MTNADIAKVQMDQVTEHVMEVTGFTQEEIAKMIFETAFAWLEYQGCDDHIANQFAGTKEFWGFWKKDVWYPADCEFIRHYCQFNYEQVDARYFYECFHRVQSRPMNTAISFAGYHSLIKQITIKR